MDELEEEIIVMKEQLLKPEQERRKEKITITGINNKMNTKKGFKKIEKEKCDNNILALPSNTSRNAVKVIQFSKDEIKYCKKRKK